MPFLIPALLAGASDVLILVLQEHRVKWQAGLVQLLLASARDSSSNIDEDESSILDDDSAVHKVWYLAIAAALRLYLLLLPLPYHSYTGTAIRFLGCYTVFYVVTLAVVIFHMLAFSMVDPDSLANLLPTSTTTITTTTADTYDNEILLNQESRITAIEDQLKRSCWWILLLSLLSIGSHIVMLIHVRSTAPLDSHIPYHQLKERNNSKRNKNGTKQKLVYYYASSQRQSITQSNNHDENDGGEIRITHPTTPKLQIGPLISATYNNNGQHQTNPLSPMKKLTSHYDEFVTDLQSRVNLLKSDWTSKLDDFTQRHLHPITTAAAAATGGSSHHHHNNPLLPLTPFRVLLQLFAYQDVIDSGKLDAVFDMDSGQSLTFFVPQLLSFLLHGAYYESDPTKLEAWILNKCTHHVHFAHRCFWFLKAWSLEQPYHSHNPNDALTTTPPSHHDGLTTTTTTTNSSASTNANGQLQRHSRNNSWSSLTGGGTNNNNHHQSTAAANNNTSQKLLPEESAAVEDLMRRVVQCGEASARLLLYGTPSPDSKGSSNGDDTTKKKRRGKREKTPQESNTTTTVGTSPGLNGTSNIFWDQEGDDTDEDRLPIKSPSSTLVPDLSLTKEMEAALPVDPNTGFPSHRHLETLSSPERYGFTPLSVVMQQQRDDSSSAMEAFQSTPRFLDALLELADGLFLHPRDQRKNELRKQLRNLEVEMLPSNAVYVPISDVYHRVWSIVVDESIALNTKERVPCIILLEVVDYSSTDDHDATNVDRLEDGQDSASAGGSTAESWDSRKVKEKHVLELPKLGIPKLPRQHGKLDPNLSPLSGKAGPFSLPYYTLMGGMSEKEIVSHWRYARRDPHRGESILDKMTHSLPLDMNRIKKGMNQLRDKQGALLQDLLSLTSTNESESTTRKGSTIGDTRDCLGDGSNTSAGHDQDSEIAAFLCQDSYESTSILVKSELNATHVSSSRDVSPEREPSDTSMGQWTSPTAKERPSISFRDIEKGIASSSAYGSTHEGRGTANINSGRPPRADGVHGHGQRASNGSSTKAECTKSSQQVVFQENWQAKEERLRAKSAFGSHPGWRLLPILVKANDDLRQEQLASQLIQRMAFILARERVPVWLCPYEIIAITDRGGIVEAIQDTISLDSLKRNDPNFVDLNTFFHSHFGDNVDNLADAKSNFVESLAAYSIVTFLLQVKDRHNGNILLDNRGHIIHIDFGFFFLSSPGKNTGFESAPFKLTKDFVEVLGGPDSHTFKTFRELCVRSFIVLRRHCMEIILLVEMLKAGNEDLGCFLGRPDDAIEGLRDRFRLDLSDRACKEYVNYLIDESLENWRTNWYDRYQRYCVGVL